MTPPVINVAAVSYLNTIPFLYGIAHSANKLNAKLLLSPPSGCAEAFASRRADIALVPVGGLATLTDSDYDIVTPWCIGADGPVRTVVLLSDGPLNEIRRVWLDGHSLTSVALARTLAAHYWHITPRWEQLDDYSRLDTPAKGDAFVVIGDKVFGHEGRFAHTWDLAAEWKRLTGLPFVFAVWVARKSVPDEVVEDLEEALTLGMERIWEAVMESGRPDPEGAYDYLTRNIDFFFDEQKRRSLRKFWDEGLKATLHANPG